MKQGHVRAIPVGLALLLGLSFLPAFADETASRYGKPLGDHERVGLMELLAEPERYVDRVIEVEGTVEGVCPKAGCWLDLLADPDDPTAGRLRVKVNDGEIVLPAELTGKRVAAQGKFVRMELSGDAAIGYLRHEAEERGDTFDPSKAPKSVRIYRIQGTGVETR